METIIKHLDALFVNGFYDSLIAIVLLLIIGWIVNRVGRHIIKKMNSRNQKLVLNVYTTVIRILIIIGIGQQLKMFEGLGTALITSSGIIAVVLSLTAQETLNDIISGVLININRPYEIGDVIKVNDRLGTVTEINLPNTVIKTSNNSALVIPNSVMNGNGIENLTRYKGPVNNYLKITISRTADIAKAKKIMADIIAAHPGFVDTRSRQQIADKVPAVNVLVASISETGVELSAAVWSTDFNASWQQLSDLRQQIMTAFAKNKAFKPVASVNVVA